ncbi:MAG: alpha/beta hydrolase [Nevskia sp.]|nr:alpha/beta hydrolase [Nevskia sp.]
MRRDIEFLSDGLTLRGWLYTPDKGSGPFPTVVMAHGFSGVKEMGLDLYAEVFAAGGLASLVYDNRCLGASDGQPRCDIDPVMQMRDYRSAITYAQSLKECDSGRIGVWGTSYTGGTVCKVGALDRRVRAVVSQVPFLDGHRNIQQFTPVGSIAGFHKMLDEDRARRAKGEPPQYSKITSKDPTEPHLFPGDATYNYIHQYVNKLPKCTWENRTTIRSLEYMLEYETATAMGRLGATPLLMIVSEWDTTTPTDIALDHFALVKGPKQLMTIKADHYAAYTDGFAETSAAARDWFNSHL